MNPVIVVPTFVSARRRKATAAACSPPTTTPRRISQPGELPRLLCSRCRRCAASARSSCSWSASRRIEDAGRPRRCSRRCSRFPIAQHRWWLARPSWRSSSSAWSSWAWASSRRRWAFPATVPCATWVWCMANVLGFDSVVFLDDDEVVDDADFLQKAMYGLGKLTSRAFPSSPRRASTSTPRAQLPFEEPGQVVQPFLAAGQGVQHDG